MLNLPPDRRGLIHQVDAECMKELGRVLQKTFNENLALGATGHSTETMNELHDVNNIFNGDKSTYWCPREGTETAVIDIQLDSIKEFNIVVIMENIKNGQRIESFTLEYKENDEWKELYKGTVIGYKRICCFQMVEARYLRLSITSSRWCPTVSSLGVYCSNS